MLENLAIGPQWKPSRADIDAIMNGQGFDIADRGGPVRLSGAVNGGVRVPSSGSGHCDYAGGGGKVQRWQPRPLVSTSACLGKSAIHASDVH